MFGYPYDAAGNQLSNGLFNNMTWDADSRLTSVGRATYIYDAEGNRVEKQGATVTDTIYFAGQPIARLTAGQWTDLIYGPTGLLAEVPGTQAGSPVYRLTDNLGTGIGSLLANGSFVDAIDHSPFGQIVAGTTNDPYFFTGKERDAESGLDYFGARYYASSMGRWMSPDPAGPWVADVSDPQSWNMYSYARNNPLVNTDTTGYDCVYLNNSGTGAESVDTNSSQGECMGDASHPGTGGYWVNGTFTSGTVYSNSNDVYLHGYDASGLTDSYTNSVSTKGPANVDSGPNFFPYNANLALSPDTLMDMVHTLNRSGQSDMLIACIIYTESGAHDNAANSASTAKGLMQVLAGKNGVGDVVQHGGGDGMNSGQLYSQLNDPAVNIDVGTSLLKLKVGYAHGNVQSGLDLYGTGAPYGQKRLACANHK